MNKSTKITIFGQDREVKFPTVGQLMDIESRKMLLTNGTYQEMVKAGTETSEFNLDLVDALSFFLVLIPNLSKSLDVASVYMLDALEAKGIVGAYRSQFKPWYEPFAAELYKDVDFGVKGTEGHAETAEQEVSEDATADEKN